MFAKFIIFFDFGKNSSYFCGYKWLYGPYFGRFWGFMADYKAVAMGQVVPLGRVAWIFEKCARGDAAATGGQDYFDFEGEILDRISRLVHARGIDESVPVRILWAPQEEMRLQWVPAYPLYEQDFGSVARRPRPPHHSSTSASPQPRLPHLARQSLTGCFIPWILLNLVITLTKFI